MVVLCLMNSPHLEKPSPKFLLAKLSSFTASLTGKPYQNLKKISFHVKNKEYKDNTIVLI